MIDTRTSCPDAQLEPDEPKTATVDTCAVCGYEIQTGEEYFDIDGVAVCDECGAEYLRQHRKVVSWNDIF